MRKVLGFMGAAGALLIVHCAMAAGDSRQSSVVKIVAGCRAPDYFQPWDMNYQNTRFGSGFIVEGKRIMTNAHVVSDQVYIQVIKVGDPKKYTAKVEYMAHDCEIALLKVEDEAFFAGTKPVRFGGIPQQRDRVAAYGFPTGGEVLSITEGIVSRVEMQNYSHSQREFPAIQIDAAINAGNSGGPVFKGDEVVGISFQTYASTQNIAYIVPTPVIKRFYADIADGNYEGAPLLGIRWKPIESPAMRRYYGLAEKQGGILATSVLYQSSTWGVVKDGDVVLAVAGTPIERDGTIELRKNERVNFTWLLSSRQMGEKVDMDILRDGAIKRVTVTLVPCRFLVPLMQYDRKPTYIVFAGFVFMPLNYNYLSRWSWNDMDPDFRILFSDGMVTPERRQAVIINQVLLHDINIGYQDIARQVIGKVNGKPVGDMAELAAALAAPVGDYHTIEIVDAFGKSRMIVLDAKKMAEANADIMKRFSIPADRSEDLKQ